MATVAQVNIGDTFNAPLLNTLVNALQVPSGSTEAGHYVLAGNTYATGAYISTYAQTISSGVTPVSVSLDTVDGTPTGNLSPATPNTGHLSTAGCQVYSTGTGAAANCYVGGNITFTY